MHILIIEDEQMIRDTLREMLELNGHTVSVAGDGAAGIQLAARHPDFILCDVGMPGMDGFEVIEAIQQNPETSDIPFIFLTARADRRDQRRGMNLGADDYITKPFTEKDIIDAIAARVRRQRPLRQRIEGLMEEHRREAGASWSHELMTPLTGVLGGLELIESEADSIKPDELRDLLGLIRAGAERQQALSTKLVLYFELEQAKVRPGAPPSPCEAAEAVPAGVARASEHGLRKADVTLRCDPGLIAVNELYLIKAVSEVVDNALRFSRPGQPVTVTGRRSGARYWIEVTDEGSGMTAEQCAGVGPFTQFGRAQHEQQGLGLGVAIAQSVAQLAGGHLRLEPGPGGRGVRAVFDLPCA